MDGSWLMPDFQSRQLGLDNTELGFYNQVPDMIFCFTYQTIHMACFVKPMAW